MFFCVREHFLETGPNGQSQVWQWNEQYGGRINNQLKRLGASLNWDREVFTLDTRRSECVTETFLRLWEKGLIYRYVAFAPFGCAPLRTYRLCMQ